MWKLKRATASLEDCTCTVSDPLWQPHLKRKGFSARTSDPNLYFHAGRKVYVLRYVSASWCFLVPRKTLMPLLPHFRREATLFGRKMRRTTC